MEKKTTRIRRPSVKKPVLGVSNIPLVLAYGTDRKLEVDRLGNQGRFVQVEHG